MKLRITGVNKAAILVALYNASRPMGMGMLQAQPGDMTMEEAQELLCGKDSGDYPGGAHNVNGYFDYLYGRPLKTDVSKDTLNTWGFDRDNGGDGAALRVLQAAGLNVTEEVEN